MSGPEAFIHANTTIAAPPLVPEIRLHLAAEVTPLWQATESALHSAGLAPPYWAFAWPGGQALARLILDRPALVRGLAVLDFACGSGLEAIAAAMAGAARSAAADIDGFALAAVALNAVLNDVVVERLTDDVLLRPAAGFDVVLAGDVCYERPMAEAAMAWLRAEAQRGALVLLGDPGRSYLPASGLDEIARYEVPTSLELEDRTARTAIVWRVLPTDQRADPAPLPLG